MPKLVNHGQRRQEIVEAVWRVISRKGIANATTREIALESGYSSGVLAHYFENKQELMISAMIAAHDVVRKRVASSRLIGLEAAREYMLECLPLDQRRELLAAIEASFWGQAVGNAEMISASRVEADRHRAKLLAYLREAQVLGQIGETADIGRALLELRVLMDGLSAQVAAIGELTPKAEQIALLDAVIERLKTPIPNWS